MIERDAFAGGIVFGGLRNMLQIKILICYILTSVELPLKRNQLCDSLQETGMVNYFDANIAIDELLESGSVVEIQVGDETCITTSPTGKNSAHELENILLPGIRERAVKAAMSIANRARSEKENRVEVVKVENGYDVVFEIENLGIKFFSLTINVPDILQAEQLKESFFERAGEIYSSVIDMLIK